MSETTLTSVSTGSLRDGARFQEWRCAHSVHIVVFLNDSLSVQIINKKNVWNQLGFLGAAPLSSGQGGGGFRRRNLRPSDSELVPPPRRIYD